MAFFAEGFLSLGKINVFIQLSIKASNRKSLDMTCWFFMGWSNKDSLCNDLGYLLLPGLGYVSHLTPHVWIPIHQGKENWQALRKVIFCLDPSWHTLSNQKLPLCPFYKWGNWGSTDEKHCLKKILLDKAVTEHCQSSFNTAVAIRELNATLGFFHISNYFRREEVSLWQD